MMTIIIYYVGDIGTGFPDDNGASLVVYPCVKSSVTIYICIICRLKSLYKIIIIYTSNVALIELPTEFSLFIN